MAVEGSEEVCCKKWAPSPDPCRKEWHPSTLTTPYSPLIHSCSPTLPPAPSWGKVLRSIPEQVQGRKKSSFVSNCVFVWVGGTPGMWRWRREGRGDAKQTSTEWELLSWWETRRRCRDGSIASGPSTLLLMPSPVVGYFRLQRKRAGRPGPQEPEPSSVPWELEPSSGNQDQGCSLGTPRAAFSLIMDNWYFFPGGKKAL